MILEEDLNSNVEKNETAFKEKSNNFELLPASTAQTSSIGKLHFCLFV